jgi:CBS domain-containing protein
MQIDEIMTRAPRTITATTTIGEAWDVLRTLELRHLPVTNEDREFVGFLSDRHFSSLPTSTPTADLSADLMPMRNAPVSKIMTRAHISVEPDDRLHDVVDLMIQIKVDALPVLGLDDQVVGMVSTLDVLKGLRESGRDLWRSSGL